MSKGRGWHGEPGRHAQAARGIRTVWGSKKKRRRIASRELRDDAFIALDDIPSDDKGLSRLLQNWDDVRTYAQVEKALEYGLDVLPADASEDHLLNVKITLDDESGQYRR